MVTLFKGTKASKNNAPQAVALCAGIAAVIDFNKTLIVQLTAKYPVEEYILGKRQKENEINDNRRHFVDNGIDSLMRHAGLSPLTDRHFRNAVLPAVDSDNLFDILPVSQKPEREAVENFVEEFDKLSCVISDAKKIYANIFILADDKDHTLIKKMLPLLDNVVTCIGQGTVEERETDLDGKEEFLLVNEYDYKSTYSDKSIAKAYGVKKVYTMAYNVEFKDAYTDRDLIRYIIHNGSGADKSNASYRIMKEMIAFTRIVTHISAPEEDTAYTYSTLGKGKENTQLTTHTGNEINIEEKEVKRGLFGKRKRVKEISVKNENSDGLDMLSLDDPQEIPSRKERKKKRRTLAEKETGLLPVDEELLSDAIYADGKDGAENNPAGNIPDETSDLPAIPIWCEDAEDTIQTVPLNEADSLPETNADTRAEMEKGEDTLLTDGMTNRQILTLFDEGCSVECECEECILKLQCMHDILSNHPEIRRETDAISIEDKTDESRVVPVERNETESMEEDTEGNPDENVCDTTDETVETVPTEAEEKKEDEADMTRDDTGNGLITDEQMDKIVNKAVEKLQEAVASHKEASSAPESPVVISAIERLRQDTSDKPEKDACSVESEVLTEGILKPDRPLTGIEWLKEYENGGGRNRFKYMKEVRA